MAKATKQTAEQVARQQGRQVGLARVHDAIQAGRAYLDTAFGRYVVKSYNDDSGYCTTLPVDCTDAYFGRGTFLVCLEAIQIEAA